MIKSFAQFAVVLTAANLAFAPAARAQAMSASLEIGSERDKSDLAQPILNYDFLTVTQTFPSGFYLGGSLQNYRSAHDGPVSWNFEGIAGYRATYSPSLSLFGSAGLGEHLADTREFPYYIFRLGVDDALDSNFVWNAIYLRYRSGFDPQADYLSSIAGTGLTYQLDDGPALFTKLFGVFDHDYHFEGVGISIGLKINF